MDMWISSLYVPNRENGTYIEPSVIDTISGNNDYSVVMPPARNRAQAPRATEIRRDYASARRVGFRRLRCRFARENATMRTLFGQYGNCRQPERHSRCTARFGRERRLAGSNRREAHLRPLLNILRDTLLQRWCCRRCNRLVYNLLRAQLWQMEERWYRRFMQRRLQKTRTNNGNGTGCSH